MTKLVCTTCERPWQRPGKPKLEDLRCECGGTRTTPMMARRYELKRVSDKRMEAEGERLAASGSTLRSRRRKPISLKEFWLHVTDEGTSGCALAFDGGCWGKLDAHHFIAQQRLRRAGLSKRDLEAALTDPRAGVPLCRYHHGQVEAAKLECPRPVDLDEFLEEFGLTEAGRRREEGVVRGVA